MVEGCSGIVGNGIMLSTNSQELDAGNSQESLPHSPWQGVALLTLHVDSKLFQLLVLI